MGTWGTGIYQNDTGLDVKNDYLSKLKAGKSDEMALAETLSEYYNALGDDEEMYDVFFALADVMWKNSRLTEKIKQTTLVLIEEEKKTARWKGEELKRLRNQNLERLKRELKNEMPDYKKITIHRPYISDFEEKTAYFFQIIDKVQGFEKYIGWYVIMYVDKIEKEDWQVQGIYDDIPEVYFFVQESKPNSVSDIDNATPICFQVNYNNKRRYRMQLVEKSRRARKRDVNYLGLVNNFKYPYNEDKMECFFWKLGDRDILWGYETQINLESNENNRDF